MRVNWDQSLQGYSLLEIRDMLRSLRTSDAPFSVDQVATWLTGVRPGRSARARSQLLIDDLIASNIVRRNPEAKRAGESYVLTDTGMSLRAANATKRFKRARADRAVARLLELVAEINADPIYLHDVKWIAVFGSYLTDEPDLGDVDIAIELEARWKNGLAADSDYADRKARFEARFPPPESFYQKWWWASWPETYTRRRLSVDPGLKIIDRSQLEGIGCPYRIIFPEIRNKRAKSGWSFNRCEVVLRPSNR